MLFGLDRYGEVIEAYITGLEELDRNGGDLTKIASVASFFVSRVDTEVDRRLEAIGTPEALALRGKAAVANAQLAYELFLERFDTDRWKALAAKGAAGAASALGVDLDEEPRLPGHDLRRQPDRARHRQHDARPDARRLRADHGTLARTVDADLDGAQKVMDQLAGVGIDMGDVTKTLEEEGVASFSKSFDELITSLETKADQLKG